MNMDPCQQKPNGFKSIGQYLLLEHFEHFLTRSGESKSRGLSWIRTLYESSIMTINWERTRFERKAELLVQTQPNTIVLLGRRVQFCRKRHWLGPGTRPTRVSGTRIQNDIIHRKRQKSTCIWCWSLQAILRSLSLPCGHFNVHSQSTFLNKLNREKDQFWGVGVALFQEATRKKRLLIWVTWPSDVYPTTRSCHDKIKSS